MFFYSGENCPILSLTQVQPGLYLDEGWTCVTLADNLVWYKGYSTDCVLSESIERILQGNYPAGKWCIISDEKIYYPDLRGFPVFVQENDLTNIQLPNFTAMSYDHPRGIRSQDPISLADAATLIGDILIENTRNFYKYNKIDRMKMLFTCGLDSMTSWVILDQVTKEYDLEIYIPKRVDDTFERRMGVVREKQSDLIDSVSESYWGYRMTSVYNAVNWNMTGFYSERVQLREGDHLSAIANFYGKNIRDVAAPTDYLYKFLQRAGLSHFLENTLTFADETAVKDYCFDSVYYDHQMWHLDNNFHFSPFNDIRITEVVYRLSLADILSNGVNGLIQREIIKRFWPEVLTLLSDFKNEGAVFGNFSKNFGNIKMDPSVKIKIR